ncbi:MAG: MBOAT family protein, partial [Bacteroidia bacterium]|nr:MBOAT family protein [Bacteroidia bacterium]
MLFNSIAFLIFLPIVFAGYFLLPHKIRWAWLLLSGYVFYGWWRWEYLGILVFTTLLDYYCARKIFANSINSIRKKWMLLSVLTNLAVLFVFKYFNFFLGDFEKVK